MKEIIKKNCLVFILVIFVLLAITGVFYNYPLAFTVGDEVPIMAAALKMIDYHTLRPAFPSFYTMPFSAYLYLPFYILLLIFLRISGLFTSIASIQSMGIIDYGKLLPLARFISIIFGALSIYLVYKICQKIFKNSFISLTASFLLSTSLMFVQLSHFGRVWIPQVFIILLTFYFIINLYSKKLPKIKDYFWTAIFIGLSFGTHFIGLLIYLPFLAVHCLKNKGKKFKDIFIKNRNFWLVNFIVLIFLPIFYYINPYSFNNYGSYILRLFGLGGKLITNVFAFNEKFFYLKILWEYEPILLSLFIPASVLFFIKKRDLFYIFFSFVLGYYFLVELILSNKEPRYILPIIPFMSVIVAYSIYCFYKNSLVNRKIKISILVILFLSFFYLPVLWDYKLIQPSTRLLTRDWVYRNLPSGTRIINLDPDLKLNLDRQSIENIKKYNPKILTKKNVYLLASDDGDYPRPNYYILNSDYFDQVPGDFSEENKFQYLIIRWWNNQERNLQLKKIEEIGLISKLGLLVKFYPADKLTNLTNLANNMRKPFLLLNAINKTGPYIEIYKID